MKRLEARLADKQITMSISEKALDHLADVGFDPVYGARPLKRTIQREVETTVARGILKGDFTDGDSIICDVDDDIIIVKKAIDAEIVESKSLSGSFE